MAKRLTAIAVENAPPRAQSYELKDASSPLRLVVHPSRAKSWIVRYRRPDGRTAKLTHEQFVPLAEARKWAAGALAELAQGRDPGVLKEAAAAAKEQAATDRQRDTVDRLADQFIEQYAKKHTRQNSWRQAVHVFDDIVLPAWRGRIIHDIQRREIRELVEGVAEDRPVMANRALAHLSKFFNWLLERDVIQASPCTGVKPPRKEHARERILSDDEIVKLWRACDTIDGRVGPCVKLLLLTGQRLGEVGGMQRSEIVGDTWSLSPERTKNARRHDVPLSTQALAIINAMPVIEGQADFVFTASHTKRLGRLSHGKAAIDAIMKPREPWVLHDLRRTAASGMQRLGVRVEVIERALNHRSGSYRGVAGIYQVDPMTSATRDALQRWANHVEGLVSGKQADDKVVQMPARR
jgi:integrase